MARYRSFLFPDAILREDIILLDSRESHHLARVFRAREGETIEVLDGKGTYYTGTIQSVSAKTVSVSVESVRTVPVVRPRVLLLQSESNAKCMDIVLRMATEIGVSVVQPVFTEQGEHLKRKKEKRLLLMIEACKQCGLSHVPELYEPCDLRNWLQSNAQKDKTLRLVASLEEGSRPLLSVLEESPKDLEEVVVAVGPAGDFSSSEYELLLNSGFKAVRLGANVLRVETAAAYILSVVDQVIRGTQP
jgi:16S rRNA (uracil1498-N3)-methyltransferase